MVIRKASRTGIQVLILDVALEVASLLPRLVAVRLDDLVAGSKPKWMRVVGDFNVRGGVKSVITVVYGKAPAAK